MKRGKLFHLTHLAIGGLLTMAALLILGVEQISKSYAATSDQGAWEILASQNARYELIIALLLIALIISILNGIYGYYTRDKCYHTLSGHLRDDHRSKKMIKK